MKSNPARAGQIWTIEETRLLRQEFAEGATLQQMMARHERTAYAIIGKLQGLGLIILVGTEGYHKVEQDPWMLVSVLQNIQEQGAKS